ncbi:aromatic prenyltransferase [Aspergillus insuetus]
MSALNDAAAKLSVFETISRWLPRRNPDSGYWWDLTGPQMAAMFEEAGYEKELQFENLLIHYYWTVPYMGSAPSPDGSLKWNCILTGNGVSMVYSWKWNTSSPSSKPDIRIGFEPIGVHSATALDPLNQLSTKEILHTFKERMPLSLDWTNHFLSACFDSETKYWVAKEKSGIPLATTVMIGHDYLHDGLTLKTYFFPRVAGERLLPWERWDAALRGALATHGENATSALDVLSEFLKTSPEGQALVPTGLALDNGTTSPTSRTDSRVKFYFRSPKTTFASVREIMTLGGRISTPHLEVQLGKLHSLLEEITGLPENYPDDADVPVYHGFGTGNSLLRRAAYYLYYFDIAPGAEVPDIKFYTALSHYGQNDRMSAEGTCQFMEREGRGAYAGNYMRMLERVAGERTLETGNGLQSYLAVLFRGDGELDVTSYFLTERC